MRNKYTKEKLELVVETSKTWAEVCRKIGVKPMTGSQSHLKRKAVEWGIDSSHFVGKSFNKGRSFKKRSALEYCFNGSKINSHTLKQKLIRDGIKEEKCEVCGITEWCEEPVVLELDHKDSNHYNNKIENLQIVCPNCHAQQTRSRRNGSLA